MLIYSDSFTYNGVSCKEYDLMLGTISENKYQVGINIDPIFEKDSKNDRIHYFGEDKKPLQFELSVFQKDGRYLTEDERMNIMQWLYKNKFCELAFEENLDIVYSCKPISKIKEIDRGGLLGFTIEFLCEYPYATTRAVNMYYNCSTNKEFSIYNKANIDDYFYNAEIEIITKTPDICIRNLSDNSRELTFSGLEEGEKIYIHNRKKEIISSTYRNRFSNFNRNFLRLVYGMNHFEAKGDFTLEINAKFPIIM